jgi:chromosome segregation ATPase
MKHITRHSERLIHKNTMLASKNTILLAENARFALRTKEKRLNRQKYLQTREKIVEQRAIKGFRQSSINLLKMSEANHQDEIQSLSRDLTDSNIRLAQTTAILVDTHTTLTEAQARLAAQDESTFKLAEAHANAEKLRTALAETSAKLEESQGWVRHYKTFAETVEEDAAKNTKAVQELNNGFTREIKRLEKCLGDRKEELQTAKSSAKELQATNARLEKDLAKSKDTVKELSKHFSQMKGELGGVAKKSLDCIKGIEDQLAVYTELQAANETLRVDYRESCAQAHMLFGLLERSEKGLNVISARQTRYEDACSAAVIAIQQQVSLHFFSLSPSLSHVSWRRWSAWRPASTS